MNRNKLVTVKTQKGFKTIRIELGMFDAWVNVIIGPRSGVEEFVRWFYGNQKFTCDPFGSKGFSWDDGANAPLVWIPRYPETSEEYGTLAHECGHAALYIFDWAGMKANQETCETLTHMIGWLVRSTLAHGKRRKSSERKEGKAAKKRGRR